MNTVPPVGKIIIGILITMCLFPALSFVISCIGAAAIVLYLVHQYTLDREYPYDINAYIAAQCDNDRDAINNILGDFAANCPHFDPGVCLSTCDCPDCPYGRND